ncbi:MAG TPA: hypothetical protein VKB87_21725 [Myxococcaceae bacterium]|nr:hypothetical protein [Myxococcaceae bacterium]
MRRIGLAVVLAVSLLFAPLAADAQQASKVRKIGLLTLGLRTPPSVLGRADEVIE